MHWDDFLLEEGAWETKEMWQEQKRCVRLLLSSDGFHVSGPVSPWRFLFSSYIGRISSIAEFQDSWWYFCPVPFTCLTLLFSISSTFNVSFLSTLPFYVLQSLRYTLVTQLCILKLRNWRSPEFSARYSLLSLRKGTLRGVHWGFSGKSSKCWPCRTMRSINTSWFIPSHHRLDFPLPDFAAVPRLAVASFFLKAYAWYIRFLSVLPPCRRREDTMC